jgi:hypothetical protein
MIQTQELPKQELMQLQQQQIPQLTRNWEQQSQTAIPKETQKKRKKHNHILIARKTSHSPVEVLKEGIDWYEGTKLANACFKYLSLHSCAVVEMIAESERVINEETGEVTFNVSNRMNVVYKIHTQCPHNNIQELYHFSKGYSLPYCEDCKRTIPKPPAVINLEEMVIKFNIKLNTLVGDAISAVSSIGGSSWKRSIKE